MTQEQDFRMEQDCIGEMPVPRQAFYGVHALRAKENFHITGRPADPRFTKAIIIVKWACALTNQAVGLLDKQKAEAMEAACKKILEGCYDDQFITDAIQGGAGTSFNMNANEVVANVANEILGGKPGDYHLVHPNDHSNMGQSTNDVIPTAGKIAMIQYFQDVQKSLEGLIASLEKKSREFDSYVKMGRTQLQDAVPIRLGQEFAAYAHVLKRDVKRLDQAIAALSVVNLGGTAIGTGLNADENYVKQVVPQLAKLSGLKLTQCEDLIDGTQNLDGFAFASSILKTLAINLSKIANDFRLMSSGPLTGIGDIQLPKRQAGSSIMPGKVNPVIPEVVNQACFYTVGNDVTVSMAVEAGQLELNAFEPVIFESIFASAKALIGAMDTLSRNCVDGITCDKEHITSVVEHSVGPVTALAPHIGYSQATEIANEALTSGRSVREITLEKGLVSKADLDRILDLYGMTEPGVMAEDLILK